jgi:5-methylcytosine-specific restriction enzyme subunit McrC
MDPEAILGKTIKLYEWDEIILNCHQLDHDYLNKNFKDKLAYKVIGDKTLIQTKQFVGILKLPESKTILKISPKTTSKYMELLKFAQSVKCKDNKKFFYYDLKEKVETEDGEVFFEIIAHLFLAELRYIFKRGLYKEYIKKEENINFLRGKLLISQQIRENFIRPKFCCSYFDLTVDNFVNQAMIYAALKVTKFIDYSSNSNLRSVKAEILKYVNLLKDEITINDAILLTELEKLNCNRKNDYYEEIIELTKIIIRESFFGSSGKRKSRCCNFLIDMNVIFERVVFGVLSMILEGNGYSVKDQLLNNIDNFICLENKTFQIKPDIVVFENNKEYAVIDAKYMASLNLKEYYQIIIYSLALKIKHSHLKNAVLINFESEFDKCSVKSGAIKIVKLTGKEGEDIKIYQISLYLGMDEKNYIDQIKNQLQEVIKYHRIFDI